MEYIGVDGCRAGWFWVGLSIGSAWQFGVCETAVALSKKASTSKLTLVDIPIGLTETGVQGRTCDRMARRILGSPRASSVFTPPTRPTLTAENYMDANIINRKATGHGLSCQAWRIVPKIREVDDLLRTSADIQKVMREAHPEVCFWSLNNKSPMSNNKKKHAGRDERQKLLSKIFPQTSSLVHSAAETYLRREVAWDDILDALVVAITAKFGFGNLRSLPDRLEHDRYGLPMEIVFCENYM